MNERKDEATGKTDIEVAESHTISQTGRDTDGRSPDYDASLKDGGDVLRDGVASKPGDRR